MGENKINMIKMIICDFCGDATVDFNKADICEPCKRKNIEEKMDLELRSEQDDIQENTDTMEEKLEALNNLE